MSMLYPAGDPLYAKLRPNLALSGGHAVPRGRAPAWHPALAALAQLHSEGKVTALPAIGYDHPDQSHFTSRHYWEVGATDTELRTGWLAATSTRSDGRQPAPGPLAHGAARADARHHPCPGGRDRRARPVHLRHLGRLGPGRGPHAGDARRLRRAASDRPGAPDREPGRGQSDRLRDSSSPSPTRRSSSRRSPIRRRATASRSTWPGWRR